MIKLDHCDIMKSQMSRYILFAYSNYYPSGGPNDVIATSNNPHELKHHAWEDENYDKYYILDTKKGKWFEPRDI